MSPALLPADWPAPRGVRAFTTLRYGAGVSVAPFDTFNLGNRYAADGDDAEAVARNRAGLVALAGLPCVPHWLRQVHGTRVFQAGAPGEHSHGKPLFPLAAGGRGEGTRGRGGMAGGGRAAPPAASGSREALEPEADAAVTAAAGTVLAVLTADCLPVAFCADDGSEVAAAHAGWRGLADGVLEATVAAMHTPPSRLMAWLGPAAGPQRYEVGVEVCDAFLAQDPAAAAAFTATRPGHWRVDLYALARQRLARAGLAAGRVHGGGLCTIAEPQRFYSHRRDRRTGRMATVVWFE